MSIFFSPIRDRFLSHHSKAELVVEITGATSFAVVARKYKIHKAVVKKHKRKNIRAVIFTFVEKQIVITHNTISSDPFQIH